VKECDEIFHLAGITKAVKEKTYFEVNALGTENLIHACLENNPHIQKFIYLSSQAAAGPCRNGDKKKESDQCEPVSAYGRVNGGEKSWPLSMLMKFLSSFYGPPGCMGQEIRISIPYSDGSPKGSNPILVEKSVSVMSKMSSKPSYWPLSPRQKAAKYFSFRMERII